MGSSVSTIGILQLLKVSKDTVSHKAGLLPFFHNIIKYNGRDITMKEDATTLNKDWENDDLRIVVKDMRTNHDFSMVIPKKEGSKMGISVKFHDDLKPILQMRILSIFPGSAAEASKLVTGDYILGVENLSCDDEDDLLNYLETKKGENVILLVYNHSMGYIRRINFKVGEESVFGCKIGTGIKHRVPYYSRCTLVFDDDVITTDVTKIKKKQGEGFEIDENTPEETPPGEGPDMDAGIEAGVPPTAGQPEMPNREPDLNAGIEAGVPPTAGQPEMPNREPDLNAGIEAGVPPTAGQPKMPNREPDLNAGIEAGVPPTAGQPEMPNREPDLNAGIEAGVPPTAGQPEMPNREPDLNAGIEAGVPPTTDKPEMPNREPDLNAGIEVGVPPTTSNQEEQSNLGEGVTSFGADTPFYGKQTNVGGVKATVPPSDDKQGEQANLGDGVTSFGADMPPLAGQQKAKETVGDIKPSSTEQQDQIKEQENLGESGKGFGADISASSEEKKMSEPEKAQPEGIKMPSSSEKNEKIEPEKTQPEGMKTTTEGGQKMEGSAYTQQGGMKMPQGEQKMDETADKQQSGMKMPQGEQKMDETADKQQSGMKMPQGEQKMDGSAYTQQGGMKMPQGEQKIGENEKHEKDFTETKAPSSFEKQEKLDADISGFNKDVRSPVSKQHEVGPDRFSNNIKNPMNEQDKYGKAFTENDNQDGVHKKNVPPPVIPEHLKSQHMKSQEEKSEFSRTQKMPTEGTPVNLHSGQAKEFGNETEKPVEEKQFKSFPQKPPRDSQGKIGSSDTHNQQQRMGEKDVEKQEEGVHMPRKNLGSSDTHNQQQRMGETGVERQNEGVHMPRKNLGSSDTHNQQQRMGEKDVERQDEGVHRHEKKIGTHDITDETTKSHYTENKPHVFKEEPPFYNSAGNKKEMSGKTFADAMHSPEPSFTSDSKGLKEGEFKPKGEPSYPSKSTFTSEKFEHQPTTVEEKKEFEERKLEDQLKKKTTLNSGDVNISQINEKPDKLSEKKDISSIFEEDDDSFDFDETLKKNNINDDANILSMAKNDKYSNINEAREAPTGRHRKNYDDMYGHGVDLSSVENLPHGIKAQEGHMGRRKKNYDDMYGHGVDLSSTEMDTKEKIKIPGSKPLNPHYEEFQDSKAPQTEEIMKKDNLLNEKEYVSKEEDSSDNADMFSKYLAGTAASGVMANPSKVGHPSIDKESGHICESCFGGKNDPEKIKTLESELIAELAMKANFEKCKGKEDEIMDLNDEGEKEDENSIL